MLMYVYLYVLQRFNLSNSCIMFRQYVLPIEYIHKSNYACQILKRFKANQNPFYNLISNMAGWQVH